MKEITQEKLNKYLKITQKALDIAKSSKEEVNTSEARSIFLDMVERYMKDAYYFKQKNDFVNAFAAINYAHGWLDAGARIGIFKVKDSNLFTVDDD